MKIIHHFKNQENLNLNEKRQLTNTNKSCQFWNYLIRISEHHKTLVNNYKHT